MKTKRSKHKIKRIRKRAGKLDSVPISTHIQEPKFTGKICLCDHAHVGPCLDSVPTSTQIQVKKHGGKRAGAGRKKDPDSIRGSYARATELQHAPASHRRQAYTLYECRQVAYIQKHGHKLLTWMYMIPDKSTRALTTRGDKRGFISLNAAAELAHLPPERQLEVLGMMGVLNKFVDQYKDDTKSFGENARSLLSAWEKGRQEQ